MEVWMRIYLFTRSSSHPLILLLVNLVRVLWGMSLFLFLHSKMVVLMLQLPQFDSKVSECDEYDSLSNDRFENNQGSPSRLWNNNYRDIGHIVDQLLHHIEHR